MSPVKCALLFLAFASLLLSAPQDRTRNPHGPLPVSCEACHTATAWTPIRPHPEFNHNTQTAFRLTAMHANVSCQGCHTSPVFRKTAHDCGSCHADLHRAQMGRTCQQCHTERGWTPAVRFASREHSNRFPLLGAHSRTQCESCHRGAANAVFVGMSTECVSCHRNDFASAQNPPHRQGSFPLDCRVCHASMNSWQGAKFDHTTVAHFALTGAHSTLACGSCHIAGRFAGTPAACVNCHQADLRSTTNPNHITAGFSTECSLCHSTSNWTSARFDHNLVSGFPLTGAHATVGCAQCHNGNYSAAPRACNGCHMPDFNQTTNPNHPKAGFPTDCALCHSTTGWSGAAFDHSKSAFPLTGAHVTVACAQCHTNNNFTSVAATCDSCHLATFKQTSNPNHTQAGFPLNCALCHSTANWTGATFDHSKTVFPLTGSHVRVVCASCHVGNNYTTVPTDCYGCHKTDYTAVQNPNHIASSFPTTCATCHNTTTWAGATFNHTWFPIYSGNHARVWTTCADCHLDASNYNSFSCTACHTHTQARTDPEHRGVRNYTFAPTSCYQCHPQGRS